MPKSQKNLLLLYGAIIISFLFSITFFKLTSARGFNFISPQESNNTQEKVATFSALIAPTLSLKGDIATHSGKILWQSRIATEAANVTLPSQIQQGEHLQTGDDGLVWVQFPKVSTLIISPKSEINFAQTLETNLVYVQTSGSIEYVKFSPTPISIRAMHLLINQDLLGDTLVRVDTDTNTVTVDIKKGRVTLAFNDAQSVSNLIPVTEGKEYIFDDDSRTAVVKNLK